MRALDWRAAALCGGKTELFFGPGNERAAARHEREHRARQVCAQCPVTSPCREWARRHGEYGIWGGETDEERAAAGFPPSQPRRYPNQPRLLDRPDGRSRVPAAS